MIRVDSLRLPLDTPTEALPEQAARLLHIRRQEIVSWRLRRKAVDARKKAEVHFVCSIDVQIAGDEEKLLRRTKGNQCRTVQEKKPQFPVMPPSALPPLVIGFGPAGIFAALTLAKMGLSPIVAERGCRAEERAKAVERFWQQGVLDGENNVQFGEGGAGTFSDGKLNTGTKSPYLPFILEQLSAAGGGEELLWQAKPHVGTDRLIRVVGKLRRQICALGGEVRFSHQFLGYQLENGRVCGAYLRSPERGEYFQPCSFCILAIGHSARDTVRSLYDAGVEMRPKSFAMGARIEHPQTLINTAQYGDFAGHPALPAADYKLAVHLPDGHTAYSFCMCPGGQVVAAAGEEGGVVTNGMSYAAREGANANSALLISLAPADFPDPQHPLSGMVWQRELEQRCFAAAGSNYHAPAQLVEDFLQQRASTAAGSVQPTYRPGVSWCALDTVLPGWICDDMRLGIREMDRLLKGFALPDAVLTAPETRSSSPVQMLRDENCMSSVNGLYCCGEGAGYAGGIMSAAADGMRCAFAAAAEKR